MQEQVTYLIGQQQCQHEQFSCPALLGGSFSPFDEENDHGPQLHSDFNEEQSKPPAKSNGTQSKPSAKSQSKSKISKDKEKSSPKPRRNKTGDENEEKTKVSYYTTFQERIRGEPAAVNVGANAGLKNSNVVCYSNAILQCLASCICLSDFSPSDNHTEFELNHAFACLMNSMVKGGQSINPSSFMNIFRPLFQPPVEEEGGVNADEKEGMYYDFA